jgi:short-subunit dehydrogenase
MALSLKPLTEQVVVITGASSGIGLVTARMAAEHGVKGLVLAARSDEALQQLEREINEAGRTQAVAVSCDVGDESQLRHVAEVAMQRFGQIDTWVNNAGVSVYGRVTDVSIEDHRRLFETNFWGVVHGSRIAVEHLRGRGGAIINIGSVLSERAVPLQGMYVASKHAVKGFTDALRMELEEAGEHISVTLIKPATIDTPYTDHAESYLGEHPRNPSPYYAPENVAKTILHAATHPTRDLFVGSSGKVFRFLERYVPRLADRLMEKTLFAAQRSDRPRSEQVGLHEGAGTLRERGDDRGWKREHSLYTQAEIHPLASRLFVLVGVGVLVAVIVSAVRSSSSQRSSRSLWGGRRSGASDWSRRLHDVLPGKPAFTWKRVADRLQSLGNGHSRRGDFTDTLTSAASRLRERLW